MHCPNCNAIPVTRITATTCGYPICAKCGVYWPLSKLSEESESSGTSAMTPARRDSCPTVPARAYSERSPS
jgi:hypothetical protein